MNKKKYLIISLIIIFGIIISVFCIASSNKRNNIDKLITQLENALNQHNIEKIIDLYPEYYKDTVVKLVSQNKLDTFYNDIIANNKINIEILNKSDLELSEAKEIQDRINQEYNANITIQDYQLVTIRYHKDFGESTLQVVEINGEYFLYAESYLGEPIQYFVE